MEIKVSKEWCRYRALLEGDAEIGAGRLAIDPELDDEMPRDIGRVDEELNIVFGRLISLMRRQLGISLERLAEDADVDMTELIEIENNSRYKPELRTTHRLANYFHMPYSSFMQVAGLTARKDARIFEEAVRFAARAQPTAKLTPEERVALEMFVAVLSEQKQRAGN